MTAKKKLVPMGYADLYRQRGVLLLALEAAEKQLEECLAGNNKRYQPENIEETLSKIRQAIAECQKSEKEKYGDPNHKEAELRGEE